MKRKTKSKKPVQESKSFQVSYENQTFDSCPYGHKECSAIEKFGIFCQQCNMFFTLYDLKNPEQVIIKAPKFIDLASLGFSV